MIETKYINWYCPPYHIFNLVTIWFIKILISICNVFVLIAFTYGLHFKFFPVLLYCILSYMCSISLIQTSNYVSIHSICLFVPLYCVFLVSLYSPVQHNICHAFQLSDIFSCLLVF